MIQPFRASSGDKILAEHSHQTADAIDALANRMDPAPPISKRPIGFWARLTGYASGEFDFRQVRRVAGGVGGWELSTSGWEDLPGGVSSGSVTGLISVGKKCREASGRVGFPYSATTGMVVWISMATRNGSPLLDYMFSASLDSFWARLLTEVGGGEYTFAQIDADGGALSDGLTSTSTGKNCEEINGREGIESDSSTGEIVLITPVVDSSGVLQYRFENDSAPDGTPATSGLSYSHAEHASGADSTDWDRADQGSGRGCTITVQTGMRYDHSSTFKLYAYLRDLTFDADGHLLTVGPETEVEIDETEAC